MRKRRGLSVWSTSSSSPRKPWPGPSAKTTPPTNLLRLLRLPLEIQEQVAANKISVGHARALLSIEDSKVQKALAQKIIAKNLSVRQTEALVRSHAAPAPGKKKAGRSKDRDIQILEEEISRILGTRVMVEDRKNKGRVVIEYYSLDDLDRILAVLRK